MENIEEVKKRKEETSEDISDPGKCRAFFQPRGQNESGPMVTLIDGRRGRVVEYRSDLRTERIRFHPEIHILLEGEETPRIFILSDIRGFRDPEYGSMLIPEKEK